MQQIGADTTLEGSVQERATTLFRSYQESVYRRTDRLFATLMVLQWLAGIVTAVGISPQTWAGASSQTHWHVWAAIFLGGAITGFPVLLAWMQPGRALTRHTIAVAQMLTSALLIHLSGGRIETHFHVFGSLAFLAFYRDWKVLLSATVVVALDHFVRGVFWPQSVYGVLVASPWRWFEHAGWVLFEDAFLIISIRQSLKEMSQVSKRTAELTAAHNELQASEQRFRTLSASAPIGIVLTDANWSCLYTNPHWQSITGLSLEESLGEGWRQAFHPDDAAAALAAWNHPDSEERELTGEFRFLSAAGEVRWVQSRATAVRSETGDIIGYVGTVEDITQRKRAQKQLAESEHRLRLILESEPECVELIAADGTVLDMNPAGLAMVEAEDPKQVVGRSMYEVVAPEYHAGFRALSEGVFQGESGIAEFEVIGLKGTRRWMETHACPLRDVEGKIFAQLAVTRDVTGRKRAEADLEKAHKELLEASRRAGMAEVATGVLHNVGNVLNSVNVSATLVAEKLRKSKVSNLARAAALFNEHSADLTAFLKVDPKGKQLPAYLNQLVEHIGGEQAALVQELELLKKNVEHIKDIVAMQQSYAKISGVRECIQLSELVEDALRMNAGALMRHEVKVLREYDPVPGILVDKHKVLQILVNLIRNAKSACSELDRADKQITVRLARNGHERIKIEVSDNGVGIPPENLGRIFEHGFTTRKNGHGFGLHSGALAANEMGGALHVHSDGHGLGATFTLELPSNPAI